MWYKDAMREKNISPIHAANIADCWVRNPEGSQSVVIATRRYSQDPSLYTNTENWRYIPHTFWHSGATALR
jgi:hypothetical protein